MKKREEGAIIIEATLALTIFIFLIMTILSMVNICLAQSRIATLTHGIAKDISTYSYLYNMTGAGAKEAEISKGAEYSKHSIDEVIANSGNVLDTIGSIGGLAKDQEFWTSCVSMVKEAAIGTVKGVTINFVCQQAAKKRLESGSESADKFLQRMGIEDGVKGLNFFYSEFCTGGGDEIVIVCKYSVHVIELLNIDYDFHFVQTASTKAWAAPPKATKTENSEEGDDKEKESESEKASESESETETETKNETETESESESKDNRTIDEIVEDATLNPNSKQVMLGKYVEYYDGHAENLGCTYFNMSEPDYRKLEQEDLGWEANRKFLENQYGQGKEFLLCSDPFTVTTGAFYDEVEWLRNKGYTFEYDPGVGYWRAVPGNIEE